MIIGQFDIVEGVDGLVFIMIIGQFDIVEGVDGLVFIMIIGQFDIVEGVDGLVFIMIIGQFATFTYTTIDDFLNCLSLQKALIHIFCCLMDKINPFGYLFNK